MTRRPLGAIFLAIAILQLVPVWAVRYLPTVDGPSHVYNAFVLRELVTGHSPTLAKTFRIDWRPQPNWIGTAAMALLMTVVSPVVAEKLFVSAIVLLFALAMWLYAGAVDRARSMNALLALPFTYNWLLQAGFYNFSMGVALAFLAIAVWWRRRAIVPVALLLVVCYFAHPMALVFACGAIGLIWLATTRKWRELLVFVPVAPLVVWYVRQPVTTSSNGERDSIRELATMLFGARIAWTFDRAQMVFGAAVVALIVALMIKTALSGAPAPPPARVFLWLTLILLIAYAATPANAAGGSFLRERLTLFLYLTPIAWISETKTRLHRILCIAIVANVAYLTICYWRVEPVIERFVRVADAAERDSTIVAIINRHLPSGANVSVLMHAIDYAAAERRLADVNNYEADSGLFPIGFRNPSPMVDLQTIDAAMWSLAVDYVYAYHLDGDTAIARALRRWYRPIRIEGDAWLSRRAQPRPSSDEEVVLLPLAGTTQELHGPIGLRFRIDQTMRNRGPAPVHVVTSACGLTPSCAFDLDAGKSVALAGEPDKPPFILVSAPRGQVEQLEFSTIVRRTDDPSALPPLSIPAIPQSEFAQRRITLPDVPTNAPMNLRVWFFGRPVPAHFRVRAIASRSGTPIGEKTYDLWPIGYATTTALDHDFKYDGEPATFIIEPAERVPGDVRMWAFITTTDYRNGRTTVSLPR